MKNILEQIHEYEIINESINIEIKKTTYKNGALTIFFTTGKKIKIACSGGNDVTFGKGRESDLKGSKIKSFKKLDNYTLEIKLVNGKTVILEDDTGGEGLEIYRV